ncbi:MAG: ParB N-terminal domain-containing protein [Pseudomonadota bacterium]
MIPGPSFPAQFVQRVACAEDASRIRFVDDVASVDVPVEILDQLPLKNADRTDSPRLQRVLRSIRKNGYDNFEPIVVRIGRRGRWVVHDGGHRLTAARRVSTEFLVNLFHRRVFSIYFFVFKTPLSNTKLHIPE